MSKLVMGGLVMSGTPSCPFCGGDRLSVHTDEYWSAQGYVPYAYVMCWSCSARGPVVQRGTLTEEECATNAVKAWAKRRKA